MVSPFLFFEFADRDGKKHPKAFHNPEEIIAAHSIDEVIPALIKVQNAVNAGYYAAGYLSYEAAPAFDQAYAVKSGNKMPLLWFGIFKKPAMIDHSGTHGGYDVSDWKPTTTYQNYQMGMAKIKEAIAEGATYQVNYTMRLRSKFEGDDFSFYKQLSRAQSSNYSAYLNIGTYRILSASPELFFHWNGSEIITRPMKGTTKRGLSWEEDEQNAAWLYESEKNRAENVMIVDLLRNDLGNIAETGSVEVSRLFEIERYPTVLQMTSTIKAQTRPEVQLKDIFSALFPCGSITGAPKVSTMQIISDLEDSPREVYCGAIGFISPEGEAVFNVPIRTVVINTNTNEAEYGVGGGVTWDSTTKGEYSEMITKAELLTVQQPEFDLLESLKLENGNYVLLDRHVNRLQKSAAYFCFPLSLENVYDSLKAFAASHQTGTYKVRLLVSRNGNVSTEGQMITPLAEPLNVTLADTPISRNHPFLYHKTTHRTVYDQCRSHHPNVFDVLLWNEEGELTEFTIGNLVLELEDGLWTPPAKSGLLAGTFRDELLSTGKIKERILKADDLKACSSIWLINSVRGWVQVDLI
ncbi:para-aminobenzoate synthetase/4-amino-4-deoxychorismate lyase [Scopulibacillus daqui]|uniref:Para-aminobenzoate synthetase/4-amino-4-deoxychorismate lyase n=1 Tax=Scopulibacillus daqui TaxID=1469162 RepID=A0ABS2Q056_9BACL|nr:para-aminobenzoate synthetase/4-amino-4-deoxychorismate lyase [Scopulibacillus daqui]